MPIKQYIQILICTLTISAMFSLQKAVAQDTTITNATSSSDNDIMGTYSSPKKYFLGNLTIAGTKYLEPDLILPITGLVRGQIISLPGDPSVSKAVRNLWGQGIFSNVAINVANVRGDTVDLVLLVEERPRLTDVTFDGVGKNDQAEIKEKMGVVKGRMVTESLKKDIVVRMTKYYEDKGFMGNVITVTERPDTVNINSVYLVIKLIKGRKVHINSIQFSGNNNIAANKLKHALKDTKEMSRFSVHKAIDTSVYNAEQYTFKDFLHNHDYLYPSRLLSALNPYFRPSFLSSSKFNVKKYDDDKSELVKYYYSQGYRDAQIVDDTIYTVKNGDLNIEIKVEEGKKYYFGKIDWEGNAIHGNDVLDSLLSIKKGDVYNQSLLNDKINGTSPDELCISSLYMDDGYLSAHFDPVEQAIHGDTVDILIRVTEGPQATVRNVTISGNDRTNDYVIRRELYIYPGDKFNRSNLIRSIRMISQLGYIDGTNLNPDVKPGSSDYSTVDIGFPVTEKSSDQLELSAGYGGGIGFTGTIGLTFNNFSLKNFFKFKDWDPLPMGDGQKFSVRYQSSGRYYNTGSFSFTEPWLGGKKPIALMLSGTYGKYVMSSVSNSNIINWGGSIAISKRLKWPDDNFNISFGLNFMQYRMNNYAILESQPDYKNGVANNFNFSIGLSRNTINNPTFPTGGSNFNLSITLTPPYSAFEHKDYSLEAPSSKYHFLEYHKYKFEFDNFQSIGSGFVLRLRAKFGAMGYYDKNIGYSPFERFQIGGDGLSGYNYFVGRDVIAQRGYDIYYRDATVFSKYTAEVRYPLSLNPTATIFGLAFFEAGNASLGFKSYNPFEFKKAVGLGVRVNLPMFGLLGLDYGIGLDNLTDQFGNKRSIGAAAKFTFMMGMEPQ